MNQYSESWKWLNQTYNKIPDPVLRRAMLADARKRAISEWGFDPMSDSQPKPKTDEDWAKEIYPDAYNAIQKSKKGMPTNIAFAGVEHIDYTLDLCRMLDAGDIPTTIPRTFADNAEMAKLCKFCADRIGDGTTAEELWLSTFKDKPKEQIYEIYTKEGIICASEVPDGF